MTLKKSTCAILIFVGYATVWFAMENQNNDYGMGYLRKIGVSDKIIENNLFLKEKNKTSDELVNDFHEVKKVEVNVIEEFVHMENMENKELPVKDFPENKEKSTSKIVASRIGTYYNWLTGNKK